MKRLRRRAAEWLREVDRRRRRTRDVAVISYQKSGRTWVRFMLEKSGVRLMYDHAGAQNRLAQPFEDIADQVSDWRDWRIVFLFRDPRDTVVSSYFEATKRLKERHRYTGTIGEFARDPRYGLEKIARFNLHWLASLEQFKDGASVSYEDLQQSTDHEFARVLRFITGRAPVAVVRRAVAAGRFDNMRKIEVALAGKMNENNKLGGGTPGDRESLKTRRGQVGGWRDYFDEADREWMDQLLSDLGYWTKVAELHPFEPGPQATKVSRKKLGKWGDRRDLNPRPPVPQTGALTN